MTNEIVLCIIFCIISYIIGSFPTAYVVSKGFFGIDIRKVGSGNVGATNVIRSIGKKWGILVLIIDALKGAIPIILIKKFFGITSPYILIIVGISAILGHTYTIFLGFKGGKGVATSLGVMLSLTPVPILISILVFVGMLISTRYVSVGSISGAITYPLWLFIFSYFFSLPKWEEGKVYLGFSIFLALFIVYTHRSNIRRLLKGEEHKIGEKR
jgi:glycerol-3-phosphate acyltransferase PlsY